MIFGVAVVPPQEASSGEPTDPTTPTAPSKAAPSEEARLARRHSRQRWLAAVLALGSLIALVACDLSVRGVRSWWDRHSFTSCVVSSLLVVAITVFVVDEVIDRRRRADRSVSVAVQSLIVYGQALRAYEAVQASLASAGAHPGSPSASEVGAGADRASSEPADDADFESTRDEVRSLANMILVASPPLFDDPDARLFLEAVQRLAGALYAAVARTTGTVAVPASADLVRARLQQTRAEMGNRIGVLAGRLSARDRDPFEEDGSGL